MTYLRAFLAAMLVLFACAALVLAFDQVLQPFRY